MKPTHYADLIVWQKAMDLVCEIYRLAKNLPAEERYALSDQMRRAAVSIPSNIAEGQSRGSSPEFSRFLSIAKGSNGELETQIQIAVRLGFLSPDQTRTALSLCSEVGRMLTALRSKLSPRPAISPATQNNVQQPTSSH